ncbi:MAG: AAA family ATPase, partial [Cetobacterium sp.]
MLYPLELEEPKKIELKLGIKSSLPSPVKLLSLVFLLWLSNNRNSELDYSEEIVEDDKTRIKIKKNYYDNMLRYLTSKAVAVNDENFFKEVNENPLFNQHFESLLVGLELVWKISKIEFAVERAGSSERTGGNRYSKVLKYTRNIDILYHFTKDIIGLEQMLYDFIVMGNKIIESNPEQVKFSYALTFLMEDAKYLVVDNNGKDIIFNNFGVYKLLKENRDEIINIDSFKETKGPLRILQTLLSDGLNVYLKMDNYKKVSFKKAELELGENFDNYYNRLKNFNDLKNDLEISFISLESIENELNLKKENLSYQKIVYGAPGTGKSYNLQKEIEENFRKDNIKRVTFYDGYTYGQFVGAYKPVMYKKDNNVKEIGYEFIAGPLLEQVLNAYKYPQQDFIVVIEEINRAKVDRVFGDIFQLLDRNSQGDSEYPISLSQEQEEYFKEKLGDSKYLDIIVRKKGLYLPNNLYLWATMNSADQGVYPMDTAFKRRWDFDYISLNKNQRE